MEPSRGMLQARGANELRRSRLIGNSLMHVARLSYREANRLPKAAYSGSRSNAPSTFHRGVRDGHVSPLLVRSRPPSRRDKLACRRQSAPAQGQSLRNGGEARAPLRLGYCSRNHMVTCLLLHSVLLYHSPGDLNCVVFETIQRQRVARAADLVARTHHGCRVLPGRQIEAVILRLTGYHAGAALRHLWLCQPRFHPTLQALLFAPRTSCRLFSFPRVSHAFPTCMARASLFPSSFFLSFVVFSHDFLCPQNSQQLL